MAADAILIFILLYSLCFGARRGFYSELKNAMSLAMAIGLARIFYHTAALEIAPYFDICRCEIIADVIGWLSVFLAAYIVFSLVGTLILWRVKKRGEEDQEDAEEDPSRGPVTKVLNGFLGGRGLFYWSDKILGAAVGLVKGFLFGYIILVILASIDRLTQSHWEFHVSFENSVSRRIFLEEVDPYLQSYPTYRLFRSLKAKHKLVQAIEEDPKRFQKVIDHPELLKLKTRKEIQILAKDDELKEIYQRKDLQALMTHPKVLQLLGRDELLGLLADIDSERIHRDITAPPPVKKG